MSGLTYAIDDTEIQGLVGEIAERMRNKSRALEAIGSIGRESVRTNFAEGGRPTPWAAPKYRKGQPLRDTNRLMNSIGKEVDGDTVYIGTNVVYAAVQNYGAKKGSFRPATYKRIVRKAFGRELKFPVWATVQNAKLPWGDITAREFMLLQDEDVIEIQGLLVDWIMEGKA